MIVSPLLADPEDSDACEVIALNAELKPPMDVQALRLALDAVAKQFPDRSDFAVIDLDCFLLMAQQLLDSRLQGFDVTVLLFLLAHFNHRRPAINLSLAEIARQLNRDASQVRRSMRRLERLHWAHLSRTGGISINPVVMRSANPRFRAIHFRHASSRSRRAE